MLTLKRYAQFAYAQSFSETLYVNYPNGSLGPCCITPYFESGASSMPDTYQYASLRIPGEYRHTGRPGFLRCHDCINHQLKAEYLANDFDYSHLPGIRDMESFSLTKLYARVYPKWVPGAPLNQRYYVGNEQVTRAVAFVPINVVGACASPSGDRGNYAPVFSGVAPSGYTTYSYQGYGVTSVAVRISIPTFCAGRYARLVQSISVQVDDQGNARGRISRSASLSCRTSAGELSFNGTMWCSGGLIPSAWLGTLSIADFWRFAADPTSDWFGILFRASSPSGLPTPRIDVYRLDGNGSKGDPQDLLRFLSARLPYSGSTKLVVSEAEWSDLCDSAVDNCHAVSINGIAFLGDFLRLARSIIAVVHGDLSKVPSTLEDLWLSVRYGLTQTFRDIREVGNAVINQWPQAGFEPTYLKVHSRSTVPYVPADPLVRSASQSRNVTVYYHNNDNEILSAIRTLMDWDVWPTLENDWDLIPFSFVVDWVANLQRCCDHIDRRIYEEYILIDNVIYTTRDKQVFEPSAMNYGGFRCLSCEYVSYVRHQAPFLVFAPLRVQRGHSSAVNAVDGAALIKQIMR